jgi:uncharacterized SAM-binding protein YcdF (DUF218 family)
MSVVERLVLSVVLVLTLLGWSGPVFASSTFQSNGHAIVVLGLVLRDDGSMEPALEARMRTALDAAKNDPQAYVVVSGADGRKHGLKQAHVMAAWLKEAGVADERILMEDQSMDTKDNALRTAKILAEHDVHEIKLVTSKFHSPRATMSLREALRRTALEHPKLANAVVMAAPAPNGEHGKANIKRNLTEPYRFVRGIAFDLYEGDLRARTPVATLREIATSVRGKPAGLGNLKPRLATDRQPPKFVRKVLVATLDYKGGRSQMFGNKPK